jgi:hypothetical protein
MKSLIMIVIIGALSFANKVNAQADRDTLKLPAKNKLDREVPGMGRPDSSVIQEGKQRSDKQMGKENSDMMRTNPGVKTDHPGMQQDTGAMKKKNPSGMGIDTSKMQSGKDNSGMGGGFPGIMAKPDFENTSSDLQMKVWVSSEREPWDDIMSKDVSNQEQLGKGTHHIMVDLKNPQTGSEISGANVKLLIQSPSNNKSEVDLKPITNEYGGSLDLPETGEYQFSINVEHNGVTSSTPFKYLRR